MIHPRSVGRRGGPPGRPFFVGVRGRQMDLSSLPVEAGEDRGVQDAGEDASLLAECLDTIRDEVIVVAVRAFPTRPAGLEDRQLLVKSQDLEGQIPLANRIERWWGSILSTDGRHHSGHTSLKR